MFKAIKNEIEFVGIAFGRAWRGDTKLDRVGNRVPIGFVHSLLLSIWCRIWHFHRVNWHVRRNWNTCDCGHCSEEWGMRVSAEIDRSDAGWDDEPIMLAEDDDDESPRYVRPFDDMDLDSGCRHGRGYC